MLQDQDTCRICSGPGEDEQPLFHPCKCSGTIRYIHQDCLKTWLDHSKKTTCDVCKHPYAFTKVYAPDMPDRVPIMILIRKFVEQVAAVVLFMLRATLVAFVWLTLLPYGTVLTWRLYFRMGDVLAWGISQHRRSDTLNSTVHTVHNHTVPSTLPKHLSDISLLPYLRSLSADIFTGQIIASLIVLAFLAVFLLREWIQQNALPGVFDDAAVGEAQAPAQIGHPPPENADRMAVELNEGMNADAQQAPGVRLPELDPAARPVPDVPEDVRPADPAPSSSSTSDMDDPQDRPAFTTGVDQPLPAFGRRRRMKMHAVGNKRTHRLPAGLIVNQNKVRRRRFIPNSAPEAEETEEDWLDTQDNALPNLRERNEPYGFECGSISEGSLLELNDNPFHDSSGPGSKAGQKRKADDGEAEGETGRPVSSTIQTHSPQSSGFEFTFHLPQSSGEHPSTSFAFPKNGDFKLNLSPPEPMNAALPSVDNLQPETTTTESMLNLTALHAAPQVFELPPPIETSNRVDLTELPYPLTPRTIATPSVSPSPVPDPSNVPPATLFHVPFSSSVPSVSPQLPTFTAPPVEHTYAEASGSGAGAMSTGVSTTLPPRLATHRPSERLDVDSDEYFPVETHPPQQDGEEDEDEEDEEDARFEYYFKEPDPEDTKEMPPPLLLPDTDDEEEEDIHDVEAPRDPGLQVGEAMQVAGQDAPGPEAEAELDEERDQNFEEDLDGAMEAVGLRGPVFAVFQNAALMLFILNVSIGGGVWIPFTLGKTVSLLTLEPRRALQILHLPIRAVRLITDPSVDGAIYALRFMGIYLFVCSKFLYLRMLNLVGIMFGKATQQTLSCLGHRIDLLAISALFAHGQDKTAVVTSAEQSLWNVSSEQVLSYLRIALSRGDPAFSFAISVSEDPTFRFAEERFATLGRNIRLSFRAASNGWVTIAEGDGTIERLSAILLGYAVIAFLAALYLNTFTVGNVKSAGRAVRNAIRQQMIVLKVALFIVVELVMFPFGCGTMLDFSTLALFPEATIEARLAFFTHAPITAAFYHWLIGTMFMYQFAILLATCREIMRPGCMWFIKDPQDPTFHPIRDILDRPTLAQLRKLCMSAVMYAFVITLGVGCIVWSLSITTPVILPLRWQMREPLSEIPVDLLFVHLILPPTLHYFRPKKTVRRLMTGWWRWTAQNLRLTSFMFGGRHPDEEFTRSHWSWRTLSNNERDSDPEAVRDGSFRRAPAGDNIAFLRDQPALVEVDEHGTALDENGRTIMWAQNAEAQKAGRNHREDYTVVYVPPHFRRRILLFIVLFWLCGSVTTLSSLFVPILLGRAIFRLFWSRPVHDSYSFAVGFYSLWWGWLVGTLMVRIRIRRKRHEGSRRIRAGWFLFLCKRVFVYIMKIMWMVLWLGILLPTLVSIAVDLYIVIPLRYFINPDFTPTIHIVESWATGLVISKIIIKMQRTRPGADLMGALEAIQQNGWRRPDPLAASRDFILPVATGLVGMILLPPLILSVCCKFATPPWEKEELFRLVYPSIFVAVASFQFSMSLVGVFTKWTQGIRDKEFLVELRLRNLDNLRITDKSSSEGEITVKQDT